MGWRVIRRETGDGDGIKSGGVVGCFFQQEMQEQSADLDLGLIRYQGSLYNTHTMRKKQKKRKHVKRR
jgi:hypothetical protein